jgi:hypothetical protein
LRVVSACLLVFVISPELFASSVTAEATINNAAVPAPPQGQQTVQVTGKWSVDQGKKFKEMKYTYYIQNAKDSWDLYS